MRRRIERGVVGGEKVGENRRESRSVRIGGRRRRRSGGARTRGGGGAEEVVEPRSAGGGGGGVEGEEEGDEEGGDHEAVQESDGASGSVDGEEALEVGDQSGGAMGRDAVVLRWVGHGVFMREKVERESIRPSKWETVVGVVRKVRGRDWHYLLERERES